LRPMPHVVAGFARGIGRKYSRQRMIESYLSLFEAYLRPNRRAVSGWQPAAEES